MRVVIISLMCWLIATPLAHAQINPQTIQPNTTMADPGTNWFMLVAKPAGYVFDATTGEMQGMVSISGMTPAVQPNMARREFYNASSFYSRGVHGDRTDILSIHDFENLSPIGEIEIPAKIASLNFQSYIGLMSEGKHVAVANISPALSMSIVDIEERVFVGEISTPGCGLILPVDNNDFLTICADGSLMLIDLDDNGREQNRIRAKQFFDVHDDPIFDHPVPTSDGWLLFSHGGKAFDVTVENDQIKVSSAWNLVTKDEAQENWWPGGRQLGTLHKGLGLFYIIMHQGDQYTHHEPGSEIWVFSTHSQRKIATVQLENPVTTIMVTQENEPLLIVSENGGATKVYDALTFKHQRTIEGPSAALFVDL